jgi:hypothetical protein
LSSPSSPIAGLALPKPTPDAVGRWVPQAQLAIAQWLEISPLESCLPIFLTRFLFQSQFPDLTPRSPLDARFCEQRERIRSFTCKEADLAERCVPAEFWDQGVSELFHSSTIARAPLDWLETVVFQRSPLDCAFVIFKVHEALTKMAGLHAAQKRGVADAQEFFEGIPGFDDIFGHWVALLALSDLPDPKGIATFVTEWSKLPGFPQRFVACCTYLEASVRHIEGPGGEEEEENP